MCFNLLILDVPQLRPFRIVCRVVFRKVHTTSLGEPLSMSNFTSSLLCSFRFGLEPASPHTRWEPSSSCHSLVYSSGASLLSSHSLNHNNTLQANPHQHPQQQWTNRQVEQEKSSPLERVAIQRVQALKQQSVTGAIPLLQVSSGVALAIDGIEFSCEPHFQQCPRQPRNGSFHLCSRCSFLQNHHFFSRCCSCPCLALSLFPFLFLPLPCPSSCHDPHQPGADTVIHSGTRRCNFHWWLF